MESEQSSPSDRLADLLDSKFTIPNTDIRFGIDPLLGLVPGAGDWLAGVISLYFLILAAIRGGKASVMGRMFINILLDVLIGSIPLVGEVFDVYWKANVRNAKILQELEDDPVRTTTESRLWIWFVLIQFVVLLLGVLFLITWLIAKLLGLLL